jgi:hypothetical protein
MKFASIGYIAMCPDWLNSLLMCLKYRCILQNCGTTPHQHESTAQTHLDARLDIPPPNQTTHMLFYISKELNSRVAQKIGQLTAHKSNETM